MELLDILAKPMQVVREILDLEPDLESPSLASQLVAIKHKLDEVQTHLDESRRISREKDAIIAKLQRAMAMKSPQAPAGQVAVRPEEKSAAATSVQLPKSTTAPQQTNVPEQTPSASVASGEELKLPAAPCGPDPTMQPYPEQGRDGLGSPTDAKRTSRPQTQRIKRTKPANACSVPEKHKTTRRVRPKRKGRVQATTIAQTNETASRRACPTSNKTMAKGKRSVRRTARD